MFFTSLKNDSDIFKKYSLINSRQKTVTILFKVSILEWCRSNYMWLEYRLFENNSLSSLLSLYDLFLSFFSTRYFVDSLLDILCVKLANASSGYYFCNGYLGMAYYATTFLIHHYKKIIKLPFFVKMTVFDFFVLLLNFLVIKIQNKYDNLNLKLGKDVFTFCTEEILRKIVTNSKQFDEITELIVYFCSVCHD